MKFAIGIACVLFIAMVAFVGVVINNTLASQEQLATMLASMSSAGGGAHVGPADRAAGQKLTDAALRFNVDRGQVMQLLPTIAQYNITDEATIQDVLIEGLVRAVNGGLTNQQGVQLQAEVTSHLFQGSATAADVAFTQMDSAITGTGASAHVTYMNLLKLAPCMQPGTNLVGFAQMEAGFKNTGQTGAQVMGPALCAQ